ncbi:MAG: M23 family metallopeptidase [Thermomicrobiales bacterium]|nr:M23 family metallopeptidase [Thermomicrobiales bacterium]
MPDRPLADGFEIRHGYATENTWYNPGWWHTGEDWYLAEGDTAGAGVYAIADGEVVFAGSEYPGLVVIVRHADDLFSMYGHLGYELTVSVGDSVGRGAMLGTVLARTDGRAPSHLHFEVRTFLTTTEVNGDAPRYAVGCGFNCAPGPGYWPIDAPEHPTAMGWRNPTHVIAGRSFESGIASGAEVVVASTAGARASLWTLPADRRDAEPVGELELAPGDRFPLGGVASGPEASERTSAEGYRVWYRIETRELGTAWARAAVPSSNETGSDGRPSTVRFDLLPNIASNS